MLHISRMVLALLHVARPCCFRRAWPNLERFHKPRIPASLGEKWKSPVTSYPRGGIEVCEGEEAVRDGSPAGGRAGRRRAAGTIVAPCLRPPATCIWCAG